MRILLKERLPLYKKRFVRHLIIEFVTNPLLVRLKFCRNGIINRNNTFL